MLAAIREASVFEKTIQVAPNGWTAVEVKEHELEQLDPLREVISLPRGVFVCPRVSDLTRTRSKFKSRPDADPGGLLTGMRTV